MKLTDTIVAISTPLGNGGVGVIRISGVESLQVMSRVFRPKNIKSTSEIPNRMMILGKFVSYDGLIIDEGLVCIFRSPNSFTGEDVVEIYCHGGLVLCTQILKSCIANGARQAEAGEFTKRAFANGKIDLTKAEAISDLIHAKTESEIKLAAAHLDGVLNSEISQLQERVLNIVSQILANIDFPDHLIDEVELETEISQVTNQVTKLLSTCVNGKLIKNGINVSLIGIPNVGKSSLFNALVQENRAIVTDIPGTTRDVIKEQINIKGRLINLFDTAGIRDIDSKKTNTTDEIEKLGIQKSKETINNTDLILFILDSSRQMYEYEIELLVQLRNLNKKLIIVNNKMDLNLNAEPLNSDQISRLISIKNQYVDVINLSALNKNGLENLNRKIVDFFPEPIFGPEEAIISNSRHEDILVRANSILSEIQDTIKNHMPVDAILPDLEMCLKVLGEFSGHEISEKVVSNIFAKFCVGK